MPHEFLTEDQRENIGGQIENEGFEYFFIHYARPEHYNIPKEHPLYAAWEAYVAAHEKLELVLEASGITYE